MGIFDRVKEQVHDRPGQSSDEPEQSSDQPGPDAGEPEGDVEQGDRLDQNAERPAAQPGAEDSRRA